MTADWEVRGLFGNEYAMEGAVEELKKLDKPPAFKVLDRRNLQVVVSKDDAERREIVKSIIKIAHGFVEADAPLGKYDKEKEELKAKKWKEFEEKRKRLEKAAKH